jgi:hypothetical protein
VTLKGYLSVGAGAGNLFFQLVNAHYEKGAMILTSNRGFAEWGEVFGDPVVATALLDRLLHHAVVVQIEGASYRLRARRPAGIAPGTPGRHRQCRTTPPWPATQRPRGRQRRMSHTEPLRNGEPPCQVAAAPRASTP